MCMCCLMVCVSKVVSDAVFDDGWTDRQTPFCNKKHNFLGDSLYVLKVINTFRFYDMEPIDYLLEALPATPQPSDNVIARDNDCEEEASALTTPSRMTQLKIKHLSSSSLTKRLVKSSNCRYCQKFQFSRSQIERHFQQSPTCFLLYQRQFKISSLDGILLKVLKCISCSATGNFSLKVHLENNGKCLKFFKERLNCDSWDNIKSKIFNLTRASHSSRSSLNRKFETLKSTTKKKESITMIEALNSYRLDTSFGNYRFCVLCLQFYCQSGAVEVTSNHEKYRELDLINKPSFRRMNRHWLCNKCIATSSTTEDRFSQPKLKTVEIDGKNILIPCEDVQSTDIQVTVNTLILCPKNPSAVKHSPTNFVVKFYVIQDHSNKTLTTHYNNRLAKFYKRKCFCDTYEGVIASSDRKEVSSLSPIIDDSMIRGSDTWITKKKNTIFSSFTQFGQLAFAFDCEVEFTNIETIATCILCSGQVVTVEYEGDRQDEYHRRYVLHNHKGELDACPQDCIQTELTTSDLDFVPKYIQTYLTNVSQKQAAFIQHFVKCKSFSLNSEDFYCGIDFDDSGIAHINGILWSLECQEFSKHLSSCSLTGGNVESNMFLEYIERSVLTEFYYVDIRNKLGISDNEAKCIEQLVMKHQINLDLKDGLPLPSFQYLLTVKPSFDAKENISKSEEFLNFCKIHLIQLSEDEKKKLSTYEWLLQMSKMCNFGFLHNDRYIEVEFQSSKLIFILEERLASMIEQHGFMIGLYHYCLTCTDRDNSVILKRSMILQSFILPYNPLMLKAFQGRIHVKPINSVRKLSFKSNFTIF